MQNRFTRGVLLLQDGRFVFVDRFCDVTDIGNTYLVDLRTVVVIVLVVVGLVHFYLLQAKDPLDPGLLKLVRYCEEVLHADGVGLDFVGLSAVQTVD